jgi:hypothetical protein
MHILDDSVSEYFDPGMYDDTKQQENIKTFKKIKDSIVNNMF